MTHPQPRSLQGDTGPSWVSVCLGVTRWEATRMPLPAAGPWQALGPLPCFHLLLGRTPTSDALAKSGGGGRKWGGVPGLRSPYSVGPGRAAHFCSQRAGFPWGPLACPRPRPRPSWPRRTGGGVDAGPPPGPLPWPCLPRRAASVRSTLAPGREAAAALGGGGYRGCPPRFGQGQGALNAPPT